MAISAVQTDSTTAALNGMSATPTSTAQQIQDEFLTLLITQMKYQDPLDPMDNAEVTMQLAQMATVEGISGLNASLESMLSSQQTSQTMQAASLIGHDVLVDGSQLMLVEGLAGGGVQLATPAEQVVVNVYDANGQFVRSLELGPQEGLTQFIWDGKDQSGNPMPDGYYQFTVDARQGGSAVANTPLALASVGSVLTQDGNITLQLYGLGERSLGQVKQIF